jgi:hypothetical protein
MGRVTWDSVADYAGLRFEPVQIFSVFVFHMLEGALLCFRMSSKMSLFLSVRPDTN